MAHSLLFFVSVLLSTVYCAHLSLWDSVAPIISNTKFCTSILLSDESALRTSLRAAFINHVKKDTQFDEADHLDLCCRSFYKCDSYKSIELNYTTAWNSHHCDCEYFFELCLNNLNTTSSNVLRVNHIVDTPKCYANEYPIMKCITFGTFPESNVDFLRFPNLNEREKPSNRCSKYVLDENKTKRLQLFDLPYHQTPRATINGKKFFYSVSQVLKMKLLIISVVMFLIGANTLHGSSTDTTMEVLKGMESESRTFNDPHELAEYLFKVLETAEKSLCEMGALIGMYHQSSDVKII